MAQRRHGAGSGGIYSDGPDTLALWLSKILGFIGLTQVNYIYAEGLGMGEESLAKGLKQARQKIDQASYCEAFMVFFNAMDELEARLAGLS
ncbi:hypothetical protein [Pseudomonas sp. H3(2019)]|uniref:hypothetical protein n=1 Tax=Pseudomonas sp. H3(2019) TaxID=2598724 RepID=UPI001196911E|nr:hypothetical protein [Pseudomonas sp. H3(2019)]TVT85788.1 hypothetical protein FPT12_05535 [Pseudomonas sp. H3(2019)]